jgi:hypothetical protein
MTTNRKSLIYAGSISLDSTFKFRVLLLYIPPSPLDQQTGKLVCAILVDRQSAASDLPEPMCSNPSEPMCFQSDSAFHNLFEQTSFQSVRTGVFWSVEALPSQSFWNTEFQLVKSDAFQSVNTLLSPSVRTGVFHPSEPVLTRTRLNYRCVPTSVPDPDPHVFGPPASGSGYISQRYGSGSGPGSESASKNSKKNLDSYCLVTSFGLLSLKNDVPSKSNKQKNFFLNKCFVGILKVYDENSRIRIH